MGSEGAAERGHNPFGLGYDQRNSSLTWKAILYGVMPMHGKTFFSIFALAAMAITVRAQNLVQNPGFETGAFPPWSLTGNTAFSTVSANMPRSGTYSTRLGPPGEGLLDQTITLTIGQTYTVDFWLANDDTAADNDFSASFGGVSLLSLVNSPAFAYTEFKMNVIATSANNDFNFSFRNQQRYWYIDDVSVSAAVPEPTTLGLVVLGALGLGVTLRKRSSA